MDQFVAVASAYFDREGQFQRSVTVLPATVPIKDLETVSELGRTFPINRLVLLSEAVMLQPAFG